MCGWVQKGVGGMWGDLTVYEGVSKWRVGVCERC